MKSLTGDGVAEMLEHHDTKSDHRAEKIMEEQEEHYEHLLEVIKDKHEHHGGDYKHKEKHMGTDIGGLAGLAALANKGSGWGSGAGVAAGGIGGLLLGSLLGNDGLLGGRGRGYCGEPCGCPAEVMEQFGDIKQEIAVVSANAAANTASMMYQMTLNQTTANAGILAAIKDSQYAIASKIDENTIAELRSKVCAHENVININNSATATSQAVNQINQNLGLIGYRMCNLENQHQMVQNKLVAIGNGNDLKTTNNPVNVQ